jgi:type IV pilus assembly protein PilV
MKIPYRTDSLSGVRPLMMCRRGAQSGSTLLEVLVSMVVISFGILGHAGLQTASLKVNQESLMRSQATNMAYEVLDRMRANATQARAGGFDFSFGETPVNAELAQWTVRLGQVLRDGQGQVCRTNTPDDFNCTGAGNFVVVQVRWSETDDASSDRTRAVREPVSVVGRI